MTRKIRVVIVGGGFAGIKAALTLANKGRVQVDLISERSSFEYRPALYRSATGRSLFEVSIPLRQFFSYAKNVRVIKGSVTSLDAEKKTISVRHGSSYHYDELILGLGSVTSFFGIDGIKEHSFGVKTVKESLALKQHMFNQIVKGGSRRRFVVVGAGATGVELSAEMVDFATAVAASENVATKVSVDIVEAAPRPMPGLPEDMSKRIDARLTALGITTYYNTAVQAETAEELQLPTGPLRSQTVVWTAGMMNNPFFAQYPAIFTLKKGGRVEVNRYLEAADHIYVVGDSADTTYTGMAQTAQRDGHFVAKNILHDVSNKKRRLYRPKKPVYATPVGPGWAAVLWGKFRFYGRIGAFFRRLADLRFYFTVLPLSRAAVIWWYSRKHKRYYRDDSTVKTRLMN